MGTEIECSTMLPPMYNIDGTWIRVGSEITIPIPPEKLSAQPSLSWDYGNMITLNKLGILSDKHLIQYRTAIYYLTTKEHLLQLFDSCKQRYMTLLTAILAEEFKDSSIPDPESY